MKNIPLPTKGSYQNNLIFRLKSFIKRTRWKEFFFDKNSESNKQLNVNFGLKCYVQECKIIIPTVTPKLSEKN